MALRTKLRSIRPPLFLDYDYIYRDERYLPEEAQLQLLRCLLLRRAPARCFYRI